MKRVLFGTGAALLVLVVTGTFFFYQTRQQPVINAQNYDVEADRHYWLDKLETGSPSGVYADFVAQNSNVPIGVQHVRAHVIGEALFEVLGIEGIAVCDSNFGFGCFHGLFTVGFASEGESFVEDADAFCVEKYGVLGTGCQHGIGHGIVEYVGRDRLNDALALCERTSQPTPLLGCTSGVFMEHNTPFTVIPGVEPLPPYPYSNEQPYSRCNDVPEEYKKSCYYELGGWWEVVLKGDKKKMGELCDALLNETYRESCALGVGNIIGPTSNYNIEESARSCDLIPERIQVQCYAGAAWSMHANPEFTHRAELLCDYLQDDSEKSSCRQSYNLAQQK